mmetsp:Transcript_43060/g.58798  ORF Transcript_43060/g.58798 Transcript_43060/m.58798 type:complete len:208 (-) Transcript_43060:901-1524(-)
MSFFSESAQVVTARGEECSKIQLSFYAERPDLFSDIHELCACDDSLNTLQKRKHNRTDQSNIHLLSFGVPYPQIRHPFLALPDWFSCMQGQVVPVAIRAHGVEEHRRSSWRFNAEPTTIIRLWERCVTALFRALYVQQKGQESLHSGPIVLEVNVGLILLRAAIVHHLQVFSVLRRVDKCFVDAEHVCEAPMECFGDAVRGALYPPR